MITFKDNVFILQTVNTAYLFRVMPSGHLEHLYYGDRIIDNEDLLEESFAEALFHKNEFLCGNLISYSDEYSNLSLENIPLEMSSRGKGDIREPFVCIDNADGSRTSDFLYRSYEIRYEKTVLKGLPSSYVVKENTSSETDKSVELSIILEDTEAKIRLELLYTVFEECDVITRSCILSNMAEDSITIRKIMSTQLDFDTCDYDFIHFNGAWAREMNMIRQECHQGRFVNESVCGTSSSRNNPFVIIAERGTNEDYGSNYGINLIYSGNHYEACEVGSFGQTRVVAGINPDGFAYHLDKGESFYAPEAVMTYSKKGFNGMSQNMHRFVRNNIVRGEWKNRERPVLINSWESVYFDFDENRLIKIAKSAKEAGVELFVLDDGWFGKRNDDKSSLGDWYVNTKKLSKGLTGLVSKLNDMGMKFGIWVEPEMISEDSDCYSNHPDWSVNIPGRVHAKGRNQMLLDLTKEPVREYVIDSMSEVFGSADISYVKWDMNRIFSDCYSELLGNRQGEFLHRYVLGLYEVMERLTKKFPKILFEGCSAGGNRFDLGILCYMPQIWASDNTDAICRSKIQTGYSYGYPMSVISAHVSGCPNHQTLRNTSIETRFNVACFGILGYECNLSELSSDDMEAVKNQITLYKMLRKTLQSGTFYRIQTNFRNDYVDGIYQWICVAEDKSEAVGFFLQEMVVPNYPFAKFIAKGLDEDSRYEFYNRELKYNVKEFGDLINTVAPFHIKQNSFVHNTVARFVKMDGEKEYYKASGRQFCSAGVKLKQAFAATGYNENVRFFSDYASRIYIFKKLK